MRIPQENFIQVGNTVSVAVHQWDRPLATPQIEQYIVQLQQTINELLQRVAKLEQGDKQ